MGYNNIREYKLSNIHNETITLKTNQPHQPINVPPLDNFCPPSTQPSVIYENREFQYLVVKIGTTIKFNKG